MARDDLEQNINLIFIYFCFFTTFDIFFLNQKIIEENNAKEAVHS